MNYDHLDIDEVTTRTHGDCAVNPTGRPGAS
jgi:hypothetical protein